MNWQSAPHRMINKQNLAEQLSDLVGQAGSQRKAMALIESVRGTAPTQSAIDRAVKGSGTIYAMHCMVKDLERGLSMKSLTVHGIDFLSIVSGGDYDEEDLHSFLSTLAKQRSVALEDVYDCVIQEHYTVYCGNSDIAEKYGFLKADDFTSDIQEMFVDTGIIAFDDAVQHVVNNAINNDNAPGPDVFSSSILVVDLKKSVETAKKQTQTAIRQKIYIA